MLEMLLSNPRMMKTGGYSKAKEQAREARARQRAAARASSRGAAMANYFRGLGRR